jgi:hypothetical protein
VYRSLAPAVLLVLIAGTGCSPSLAAAANRPEDWVARLGGPAATPDTSRVEAAAKRLEPGSSRRLGRVMVAAHDHAGAWSWPDGSVVLTQALLGALSGDELTAVLAHELGHLELDTRPGRNALAGGTRGSASEEDADDAGCLILARSGLDPALMAGMLRHVAALEGLTTKAGRSALRRAARLESRQRVPAADGAFLRGAL